VWNMAIGGRGAAAVSVKQLAGSIGRKALSGLSDAGLIP